MKHIKNILLFLIPCAFLLITACKRKCQDERADNYGEGKRKNNCNYSYADDWYQDIQIDSFKINGEPVELRDIYNLYEGASYNEENNSYSSPYRNSYTAFIDTSIYLNQKITSIEILFAIPIGSEFNMNLEELIYSLSYYDEDRDGQSLKRNEEVFSFIESKDVNGVEYHLYKVELTNINQEVNVDKYNFIFSSCHIRMRNGELSELIVDYDIVISYN